MVLARNIYFWLNIITIVPRATSLLWNFIFKDYLTLEEERGGYLRSRHLQYLLSFSYWPLIEPRKGNNIYEIRSYSLKPGTMIEWGNNWARAINYRRQNQEAFAGFFSQVGRLYNVHHIWCKYTHFMSCFILTRWLT
jgi:hypothetical protein